MSLMSPCVAADEVQWEKGCVSGAVYWGDKALTDLLVKVGIVGIVSAHSNTMMERFCTHFCQHIPKNCRASRCYCS